MLTCALQHDYCLDKVDLLECDPRNITIYDEAMRIVTSRKAQEAGLQYLEDSTSEVQCYANGRKWRIFGSPWSAAFCSMAFNIARGEPSAGEPYIARSQIGPI